MGYDYWLEKPYIDRAADEAALEAAIDAEGGCPIGEHDDDTECDFDCLQGYLDRDFGLGSDPEPDWY